MDSDQLGSVSIKQTLRRTLRVASGLVVAFVLGWLGCLPTLIGFQGLGGAVPFSYAVSLYVWWVLVWTVVGAVGAAIAGTGVRRGPFAAAAFGAGGFVAAWIVLRAFALNSGLYSAVRGLGGFWDWNNDSWRVSALVFPALMGGVALLFGTRKVRQRGLAG